MADDRPQASGGQHARPTLLVVDDEPAIRDLLSDALGFAGYDVDVAATGAAALTAIRDAPPDLVVLDVNLPDLDGFTVCRRLRDAGSAVPVIFLTARDGHDAVRDGFSGGGDDYVAKPFRIEELAYRIAAVLRRSRPPTRSALTAGRLALDAGAHVVTVDGAEVSLSPTEFRLLEHLLAHVGLVRSKEQILDAVWGDGIGRGASLVETNVSYLRRKLAAAGADGAIETVRGFGYRLDPDGGR